MINTKLSVFSISSFDRDEFMNSVNFLKVINDVHSIFSFSISLNLNYDLLKQKERYVSYLCAHYFFRFIYCFPSIEASNPIVEVSVKFYLGNL